MNISQMSCGGGRESSTRRFIATCAKTALKVMLMQEEGSNEELETRRKLAVRNSTPSISDARDTLESIISNGSMMKYRKAASFLKEDETPRAWIDAALEGFPNFKFLLTEKSILFFQGGYDAGSGKLLKQVFSFEDIEQIRSYTIGEKFGGLKITLSNDEMFTIKKIPNGLVDELRDEIATIFTEFDAENGISNDQNIEEDSVDPAQIIRQMGSLLEKLQKEFSVEIENLGSTERDWKYKIIKGPVLSGQDDLNSRLNRLGNNGWELVDTQRHSIAGKQHAVCFLKKRQEGSNNNRVRDLRS